MSIVLSELRKMLPAELKREIAMKQSEAGKIRLGIELGKEKNHAQLRVLRREIARMRTVEEEMRKGLKQNGQDATLPAPEKKTKSTKKTTNTKKKSSTSNSSSSSSSSKTSL